MNKLNFTKWKIKNKLIKLINSNKRSRSWVRRFYFWKKKIYYWRWSWFS